MRLAGEAGEASRLRSWAVAVPADFGLKQAGQTIANKAGLGGITSAMGVVGPVAAVVAAGVAVYDLTQKMAAQAVTERDTARVLGVSVNTTSACPAPPTCRDRRIDRYDSPGQSAEYESIRPGRRHLLGRSFCSQWA